MVYLYFLLYKTLFLLLRSFVFSLVNSFVNVTFVKMDGLLFLFHIFLYIMLFLSYFEN